MNKHNFVESKAHGSEYQVAIYCTTCGRVVWHFNTLQTSIELQKHVGESCITDKALPTVLTATEIDKINRNAQEAASKFAGGIK